MKIRGWVYIIVNQAIKDLIKIGYSSKDPSLRASDFAQTGVPHKYRVVYDALVDDPYKVEQLVHSNLKRFNEDKEWFNCSVQQGIESIRKNSVKIYLETIVEEFSQENEVQQKDKKSLKKCKLCNGSGQIKMQQGFFSVQQLCPDCGGERKS
jgi:hypothetical protein